MAHLGSHYDSTLAIRTKNRRYVKFVNLTYRLFLFKGCPGAYKKTQLF